MLRRSILILLLVLIVLPVVLGLACGRDPSIDSIDVVPVDDAKELIENDESYAH